MLARIKLEDNELGEAAGKVRRKPALSSRRQPMRRQKGSKPVYSPKTVQHVAGGAGQPVKPAAGAIHSDHPGLIPTALIALFNPVNQKICTSHWG
jgi:hypothetical protein